MVFISAISKKELGALRRVWFRLSSGTRKDLKGQVQGEIEVQFQA